LEKIAILTMFGNLDRTYSLVNVVVVVVVDVVVVVVVVVVGSQIDSELTLLVIVCLLSKERVVSLIKYS